MNTLVPAKRSWLAPSPVVGTPAHWARHTALYGALLGGLAPVAVLFIPAVIGQGLMPTLALLSVAWTLLIPLLGSVAAGAVIGAVVGALQPAFLDRVRGRTSLPVLALGQTAVGAVAGVGCTAGWYAAHVALFGSLAMFGSSPPLAAWAALGAFLGAATTLVWWLPFTVATVLGARPWAVTVAVGATVPPLLSLLLLFTL